MSASIFVKKYGTNGALSCYFDVSQVFSISSRILLWPLLHTARPATKRFSFAGKSAGVAKLVDAPDLGSGAARRGGSSPSTRTKGSFMGRCRNTHIRHVRQVLCKSGRSIGRAFSPCLFSIACPPGDFPRGGHAVHCSDPPHAVAR